MSNLPKPDKDEADFHLSHEIVVLDAFICDALNIDHRERITHEFVDGVLRALDMSPLGPVEIYLAADKRAPGWSFIQPITTSHISAHYFERPGRLPHIRLDAYSCEPFDWREVIRVCHRQFSLEKWRANLIRRRIDMDANREVYSMAGSGARVDMEKRTTFTKWQPPKEMEDAEAIRRVG